MLKNSDERYVPWSLDFCTAYEHIHRYALAKKLVKHKIVLDLACGEGYGASLLADDASHVLGIDINPEVISHADDKYKKHNLTFMVGDITQVPLNRDQQFDVIVCFEALEHVGAQDALLKEMKRLLKPDGILIISTPNHPVYSENGMRKNPYHVKELDREEFEELIGRYFDNLIIYGQKTYASSHLFPLQQSNNKGEEHFRDEKGQGAIELAHPAQTWQSHALRYTVNQNPSDFSFHFTNKEDPLPRYFIALASDHTLSPSLEEASYLTDISIRNGYIKWETPSEPSLLPPSKIHRIGLKMKKLLQFLCLMEKK
ncbi:MAG: class I SAM-dependent methyltransferase [Parachlamydiaceae bacterium]